MKITLQKAVINRIRADLIREANKLRRKSPDKTAVGAEFDEQIAAELEEQAEVLNAVLDSLHALEAWHTALVLMSRGTDDGRHLHEDRC